MQCHLKTSALRFLFNRGDFVRMNCSKFSSKSPKITLTDDGQTIVCHHPVVEHDYVDTLPYTDLTNVQSVFKLQNDGRGENLYIEQRNKRCSMEDLQALTYTPKHVWQRRRFDGLQMRPTHPRSGA